MESLEGLKLGHYHILEQIGQGGMTSVFKAIDTVRDETVAVKVLSPYVSQDPKFGARFQQEVELLLELKHSNIVPILDYGKINGYAYIVMPFMPRGTLYNRLQGGPLTPQEGVQIVDDIVSALQYAHDHGIVHRDVKPSNILLSDDGHAMLSDFGFAHVIDLSVSLTGSALIGTPSYMSPEQCQGNKLTPGTDQYSLGILLYQICTGHLPFTGDTPMAIAVQHINEPLPRPRAANPRIPRDVERVLNKALRKRPSERYQSISDLGQAFHVAVEASLDEAGNFIPQQDRFDISTWIMEHPSISDSIALLRRAWNWRYRTAALATVLLLALPTAGFAVASFQPDSSQQMVVPIDYQATIRVLNTQVSAGSGSSLNPTQVALIVQKTMQAMSPPSVDQPVELNIVTFTPTATPTATPTEPVFGGGGVPTATPTSKDSGSGNGSGGGTQASSTPNPTSPGETSVPTGTSGPGATNTPVPPPTSTSAPPPPTNTSAPPPPTNTSAPPPPTSPPQPTSTPKPVNTKACKPDGGGNPHCE
jgi:serine/threonine protein kinase